MEIWASGSSSAPLWAGGDGGGNTLLLSWCAAAMMAALLRKCAAAHLHKCAAAAVLLHKRAAAALLHERVSPHDQPRSLDLAKLCSTWMMERATFSRFFWSSPLFFYPLADCLIAGWCASLGWFWTGVLCWRIWGSSGKSTGWFQQLWCTSVVQMSEGQKDTFISTPTLSIHPSILHLLSRGQVAGAAVWAGKARLPSPQPLHPALPGGSQAVSMPTKRHSPSSVSRGLLPVGQALNTSSGSCPGGILTRYPSHFFWLFLKQRSIGSTLNSYRMAELLTLFSNGPPSHPAKRSSI